MNEVVGIFVGASLVSLMGAIDDSRGLGAYVKLAGQLIAAGILVLSGVVQLGPVWLNGHHSDLGGGITNAMNLLDNMDGLSAGIAMIAAIFFTLLAAPCATNIWWGLGATCRGQRRAFSSLQLDSGLYLLWGMRAAFFLGFLLSAVAIKLRFPSNSLTVTWMIPFWCWPSPSLTPAWSSSADCAGAKTR